MVVRAGSGRRSVKGWLSTLMRPELSGRLPADPRAVRFAAVCRRLVIANFIGGRLPNRTDERPGMSALEESRSPT
jgi:hypothetical protein